MILYYWLQTPFSILKFRRKLHNSNYNNELDSEVVIFKENDKVKFKTTKRRLPIIRNKETKNLALQADGVLKIENLQEESEKFFDHELLNPDGGDDHRDFDKIMDRIHKNQVSFFKITEYFRMVQKSIQVSPEISKKS